MVCLYITNSLTHSLLFHILFDNSTDFHVSYGKEFITDIKAFQEAFTGLFTIMSR